MNMNKIWMPVLGAAFATFSMIAQAGGAIVAAKDSPIPAFDADEAKKVFLGRETSLGGQNVVLIYQKEGATRTAFEEKVLSKSGADLTAYWSKLIFTGKAQAPTEVGADADVKAKVNATPGAVGYVSDAAADGSVKVLFKY
jgi:ABC-type phosphate transport system substrate-binding protein